MALNIICPVRGASIGNSLKFRKNGSCEAGDWGGGW